MKLVFIQNAPIGHASTPSGAIRLAARFAGPIERALLDAGWRLSAIKRRSGFYVTMKG